jgi:hypothetical protein
MDNPELGGGWERRKRGWKYLHSDFITTIHVPTRIFPYNLLVLREYSCKKSPFFLHYFSWFQYFYSGSMEHINIKFPYATLQTLI